MGKIYVSASTLDEAINYFTHTEYSSPEQLGLFFLFKGMKFNSKEYHTFYKEGEARKKTHCSCISCVDYLIQGQKTAESDAAYFRFLLAPELKLETIIMADQSSENFLEE